MEICPFRIHGISDDKLFNTLVRYIFFKPTANIFKDILVVVTIQGKGKKQVHSVCFSYNLFPSIKNISTT